MLNTSKIFPNSLEKPSKIVIFLHGYGASGSNLLPFAHHWQEALPSTLFLAPNAPEKIEETGGYQWFSLSDRSFKGMRLGLEKARSIFLNYIDEILNSYSLTYQDLALVGFSQGAMVALDLLFSQKDIKGIIGYSGAFYPPEGTWNKPIKTKVLLVHGTHDTVVPFSAMTEAEKNLKKYHVSVSTLTCFSLDHSINEEGILKGKDFLLSQFRN